MQSRRKYLKQGLLLAGSALMPAIKVNATSLSSIEGWRMSDEAAPHKRTWMSFIASNEIWAARQIPVVQRNLATIARTIAKYEPVSMLHRKQDYDIAVKLLGGLDGHRFPIELIEFEMNDLWMRDTGPAFVSKAGGQKVAIDFNFNGWGEDQNYALDAQVAKFVAQQAGVKRFQSNLVLEGGCFEIDGEGSAIMTESCILNDNRNPGKGKLEVEAELKTLLGLDKIIWLKGIKGRDITDGHTDFYARFAKPGVVVVSRDTDKSSYDYSITRENIAILKSSKDAAGKPFELIVLDTPWDIKTEFGLEDFAAGYIGYYVCNGAVLIQKFGDKNTDNIAKQKLAAVFPDHHIEQISVDGIASGGGSIHCATQQEPAV